MNVHTLRRRQDIRTAFGKSYMNLPPEVYFTPMGLECGHSMSPYLQGSICSYVRSTSLATNPRSWWKINWLKKAISPAQSTMQTHLFAGPFYSAHGFTTASGRSRSSIDCGWVSSLKRKWYPWLCDTPRLFTSLDPGLRAWWIACWALLLLHWVIISPDVPPHSFINYMWKAVRDSGECGFKMNVPTRSRLVDRK